jgi:hypothetical protein
MTRRRCRPAVDRGYRALGKAMVLAALFGGVGLFYVGFQPGLLAVAAWCGAMALATWLTIGWVSPDNIFGVAFLVTNAFVVSQHLIPAGIGVRWFMYFRRDNVRAHFHTSRTAQTASA